MCIRDRFRRIFSVSAMTSIQQSIMNFGILCVQSLVNSFGLAAMAAFTAGVKIDSLAYSPAPRIRGRISRSASVTASAQRSCFPAASA